MLCKHYKKIPLVLNGINLSPANKNCFIILFFLQLKKKKKRPPSKGIWLKGVLIPKLINNTLAFCYFINLDFLLPQTLHFDENVILPLFVFTTFEFLFSVIYFTLKTIRQHCFIYRLIFHLSLNFFISSFRSSYYFSSIFAGTKSSWLIFESIKASEIKRSIVFNFFSC